MIGAREPALVHVSGVALPQPSGLQNGGFEIQTYKLYVVFT